MSRLFIFSVSLFFSSSVFSADFLFRIYNTDTYSTQPDYACQASITNFNNRYNQSYGYSHYSWSGTTTHDLNCYDGSQLILRQEVTAYDPSLIIDDPSTEPTTDEQCLALNDDYGDDMTMILDFDPEGLTWEGKGSGAGCKFGAVPGVAVEVGGVWHTKFEALGASDFDDGSSTEDLGLSGPEVPESGQFVPSEDYEPTDDPDTFCEYSYVDFGDGPMCYKGEYAPQDVDYPDGSTRVDNPDGSYDIVEPDGTTTEYNAEGGLKSPGSAPGTADGEEYGEDADGIIGAISSLKKAVNGGFDGVVDKLTGKADELKDELTEDAPNASDLISDSNLDEVSDQVDQAATDHTDDVLEKLDEIGDDDSSPIADQVTSHLPSLPGSSCSPLTFGTEPFAFTISCEIFTKFRNWFGWLLYFWTAVSIIDIFFAPTTRRA